MNGDRTLIATACSGPDSSVIVWDAAGTALSVIEQPHAGGTMALDFSPDGRYLATLSVPSADTAPGESGQDVSVWEWQPEAGSDGDSAGETGPRLLVTARVPIPEPQHAMSFSSVPLGTPGGGTTWQLLTTGEHEVGFWALTRSLVEVAGAVGGGGPAATARTRLNEPRLAAAWRLLCNAPAVPLLWRAASAAAREPPSRRARAVWADGG
jgi:hypothetical protein